MGKSESQNASLFSQTHNITARLRIVFLLISLVTAVAGITAVLQAKTIFNAHSELTKSALPMLTVAQRTERNLGAMFLVLENIKSYRSVNELNEAHTEIREKTERVRQNLNTLRQFDVSEQVVADLDRRLKVAETSSLRVLENQKSLFALQDEIQETLAQLEALQEKSQLLLDEFAFDFTNQMDALIRVPKSENEFGNKNRYDQMDALFIASLNVSTISFALDDVISLTRNQVLANISSKSNRALLLINAKLRDIINHLTQLPKGAARRDLAGHISMLRDIVTKDAGIFARLQSQQQFQKEFDENRATHLRLIPEISNTSSKLVTRTLFKVDSTSLQLNKAVYQLIWVISVAFLTVLTTVILTNQIVVDRQFNRRIRTLNHSVSAIAKGELDHPISVSGQDELGNMARALAVFRNNAEDLQRSNVELEKFAYVAAHDLRSPLHAIHDLSTWTIEDEESVLSVESREYLTLLQQRVERLKRLLNDLLCYARVGQNEPDAEVFSLSELVKEQALFADPEDHYHIRYLGFDAGILAQLTPLQQIIGNLLHNAVKHHDRPQGTITVSAEIRNHALILDIADDGPGIEEQHQGRIFELFQTLRPRDEVEGSGLGLAIVKKLVSRRKGRIEMFSDPTAQRGTSFRIILPLFQQHTEISEQYRPAAA